MLDNRVDAACCTTPELHFALRYKVGDALRRAEDGMSAQSAVVPARNHRKKNFLQIGLNCFAEGARSYMRTIRNFAPKSPEMRGLHLRDAVV